MRFFIRDSPPHEPHMTPAEAKEETNLERPARRTSSAGASAADVAQDDDRLVKQVDTAPKKKQGRFKQHCGRFWLWYLIGTIIFLAIFLPLLFKVIFPAIVQRIIDDQKMPILGGAFFVVASDKLNVSLSSSLSTPLPATVDPMTMFLYNKDTPQYLPFANITFPQIKADGDTVLSIVNRTVSPTNDTELSNWFSNLFDADQSSLSARGEIRASMGALHMGAKLDKTLAIPGLRKLQGFGLVNMQLVLPPLDDGTNVKGVVTMPNWGILTLGFGDLAFNVFSGDSNLKLGLLRIPNVVLLPGNNTFAFTGELDIKGALANIGAVLDSQADPMSRGNLKLTASGNSTTVNGEHVPFAEVVLNSKKLGAEVPLMELVSQVLGGLLSGDDDGNHPGLLTIIGDMFGNVAFVEGILHGFNATFSAHSSNNTVTARTLLPKPRLTTRVALNLMRMGLRLRKL
ncbi:uncharacterized protein E0L32_002510 [Thyridium curvatum]|uniref:Uncharacterized protein n=1 Tax=Thyridium curvatum TaxID=1093900 RepID=A0A507BGN1_9PEZI|nr:uncharacterized protein E0L32_002510 [Thyridium curvatum]TPX18653.1 hypothetical protein E0L32_002510 [Thyridium curvatum]